MNRRAEIAISLALFAIAWILFRTVFGTLDGLAAAMDVTETAFGDFKNIYFQAGHRILETPDPVRGFFYSPFFALLMVPIASLAGPAALAAWIAVQLLSIAGLALLAPRALGGSTPGLRLGAIALTLVSMPVAHGLSWGQVSGLLVACLLGAVALSRRGRWLAAAALIAATIAIKYYTAGALVAFLGPSRRRIATVAAVTTLALSLGLPALVLGTRGTARFYGEVLERIRDRGEIVRADPNSQYVANVAPRWMGDEPGRKAAARLACRISGLVLAGGLALLAARRARGGDARGLRDGLVLVFLATPFWVPTSWPHYFVYLPFCQLALAEVARREVGESPRRAAIGALVAVSVAVSSTPFFLAVGGHVPFARSGALLVADALLVIAALAAWIRRDVR